MYKYKKLSLNLMIVIFLICFIFEFIFYFKVDTTLFGVIYLILNLLIIFLFIPVVINYKKYFSKARVSKLILIIVFGIFSSYILEHIVIGSMGYVDSSLKYVESIFIFKNVIKGIIYFLLVLFTMLEYKLDKLLVNYISKEKKGK
ncbi:MAG: hypothetical protein IJ966_07785 [Bacilli bacterium]|nr:hypothetical protein [Bacilli bacterium]